jgi:excisionase family DNA binding protein
VSGIADASVCRLSLGSLSRARGSNALFLDMRKNHAPQVGAEDTPTLLTIEEVAAMLNVGPRFVRRLVAERRIAFHKVGHYVRFDTVDVAAWIAAGRVETTAGERRRR